LEFHFRACTVGRAVVTVLSPDGDRPARHGVLT
jgi:hypothetical protein